VLPVSLQWDRHTTPAIIEIKCDRTDISDTYKGSVDSVAVIISEEYRFLGNNAKAILVTGRGGL
jgi:hypothetical protein